jgi:hypothetical protein
MPFLSVEHWRLASLYDMLRAAHRRASPSHRCSAPVSRVRACARVVGAKGFVQRTREAQAGRIMRRADRTAADLITVAADDIEEAAAIGAAA